MRTRLARIASTPLVAIVTLAGTVAVAALLLAPLPAARAQQRTPAAKKAQKQSAQYHVAKQIAAGGEGGWDYLAVDTAAHRVYVSHATHVVVLDADRDSVVGDIPNTPGVHGIALAPALGRGWTSNGRDSSVTVFDLKTLATKSTIKVTGRNPDAILYEPVTRRVFTFNGGSASATAIDAATDSVLGTIPLGGKPEFARADGEGSVFVNIEDTGELVKFDARTLAVRARWPLAPCEEPTGLAFDRAHARLFAVCSNKLMAVVDTRTGRLVKTLPIGEGSDGAAFDPATQLAFSSNGEGTLTVVHEDAPDRFTVVGTVPTQRGARTIVLDERTHRLYTATARYGEAPAPTADRPRPRPPMIPGSFTILVLER
ncbi:MAG: YncE family protein [Gemmatimonadaceae bacterium]